MREMSQAKHFTGSHTLHREEERFGRQAKSISRKNIPSAGIPRGKGNLRVKGYSRATGVTRIHVLKQK